MTIAEWLAAAKADAKTRALPELVPMLDSLAAATERLRAADWNDDPSARSTPSTRVSPAGADSTSFRAGDDNNR